MPASHLDHPATVRPMSSRPSSMTPAQEALAKLLTSFLDLRNGYPMRELHEPPAVSIARAMAALPPEIRAEFDVGDDPEVAAAAIELTETVSVQDADPALGECPGCGSGLRHRQGGGEDCVHGCGYWYTR